MIECVVFADGGCFPNPGPGGWGAIVLFSDGYVQEIGGTAPATTNNRMEMTAAIKALRLLHDGDRPRTVVYSDSLILVNGAKKWLDPSGRALRRYGYSMANADLWRELVELRPNARWQHVKGHSGIEGNERADEIAYAMHRGEPLSLYNGPLDGYTVSLAVPKIQPAQMAMWA